MELENFFPDGFAYKVVKNEGISCESFSGIFRLSVKNVDDFKSWLNAFEEKTNTTWILKRSALADERSTYIVNRNYVCQHSSFRKRKKDNGCLQVKDKNCMASFTIKVKRNTRHTRYKDPYIQQGLHGILNINFKHSHLVNDAEAWAWLKRSEETKKIFIQYFSYGMSPSAAIKHHESSLLLEDPDLLANSRRNPPKAWVYALHESWIKGKKNYMTSNESNRSLKRKKKKEETDKSNSNTDAFEEITSSSEKHPASHQKLTAPCIIHMNRKLYDNCEDLKYLKIPNEVEDLFYKYFDDGLDVSEAMKLNKENMKKDKASSPFNPSERLVMFIYKNWSQQRRLFDKANKNTECDKTKFGPYIAEHDYEDLQSSVQNFKSTQAQNDSVIQENYSLKTISRCVPILPHPSTSKITIEKPLAVVKNVSFTSQQLASESKLMFDLNDKLSNSNSSAPNMYYLSEPAKTQLIPLNSFYFQNPVISVINATPVIPFNSVSNSIQVSLASLPSVSSVDSLERVLPSVETNSLLSDKENTSGLPSLLKKPNYFSGFFNKASELSASSYQSNVTDSCKKPEIPNDSESCNQKASSLFRPNVLDEPNSCFELNSHGDKSEIFDFNSLEDENSESTSSIDSRVKELSPVYLPGSQKSPTTTSLSSSFSLISQSHKMKANSPNCSGMDVTAESEDLNFTPTIMNINSMNSIQHLSRNEILHIETRKNGCASQIVTSNENEDCQFLMSLLPEFESIPEGFKTKLKKEMHNLIWLTKLASGESRERET